MQVVIVTNSFSRAARLRSNALLTVFPLDIAAAI